MPVTSIYTLACPISGQIRYVGKTTKSLQRRLQGHLCYSNKNYSHRGNWIYNLKTRGFSPVIELVEELSLDIDWEKAEAYWIEQFKAWGFDLVNDTVGGRGVDNHTREAKVKISFTKVGKKIEELNSKGETVRIFDNIYDLVDLYGFKKQSVLDVLCGKRAANYGRIFKYS